MQSRCPPDVAVMVPSRRVFACPRRRSGETKSAMSNISPFKACARENDAKGVAEFAAEECRFVLAFHCDDDDEAAVHASDDAGKGPSRHICLLRAA